MRFAKYDMMLVVMIFNPIPVNIAHTTWIFGSGFAISNRFAK
jgi:hypothetical protein